MALRSAVCCCSAVPPLFAPGLQLRRQAEGENAGDQLPPVLQKVGVASISTSSFRSTQRFVDETGKPVKLGDYFGKRPAILSLVYYNCPMLCSEELNGLTARSRW